MHDQELSPSPAGGTSYMRNLRIVLCSMLLAGCGGFVSTETPSPNPSVSAIPSQTTKPQLSNDQLRNMYLTAAQPFNEYTCRFLRKYGTSTDLTIWTSFAVTYAGHIRAFADRLQALDWNRKTRDEAGRLADSLALAEAAYRDAAAKLYPGAFWKALDKTDSFDAGVTRAANALRAALGLKVVRPCI